MSNTLQARPIVDFFKKVCAHEKHRIYTGIETKEGLVCLETSKKLGKTLLHLILYLYPRVDRGTYIVSHLQVLAAVEKLGQKPQHLIADEVFKFRGKRTPWDYEDKRSVPIEEMWTVRTPENLARLLKDYAYLARLEGYEPLFPSMIDFDLS